MKSDTARFLIAFAISLPLIVVSNTVGAKEPLTTIGFFEACGAGLIIAWIYILATGSRKKKS